jgi:hypothetical protein
VVSVVVSLIGDQLEYLKINSMIFDLQLSHIKFNFLLANMHEAVA